MNRTARRLRTVTSVAAAAGCLVVLAGCGGGASHAVSTPGASIGTSTDQALPKAILDLPFTDSTGKTVHLSDYAGKTIVISDTMTLCQETCPLDTATVVQTARDEDKAGMKNVVYLSITVDPTRDTTPQIAAYRKLYSPAPSNWLMLTGSTSNVNTLWMFFGVWRQKTTDSGTAPKNWRTGKPLTYDISHSDEVFFLDQHGHERFILEGPPVTKESEIPKTVYTFMSASGHKNVLKPATTAWTESQAREVLRWVNQV
ncbi:SCO family protein [Leekyejoonella antrihumi]|uniref:SCO family protein n=1 Tax=Leekyejoonella antrihumi TaxID=1660198 RepID=UPI0016485EE1|nr:SCO family protein [Leekyejoonella antrihumi]